MIRMHCAAVYKEAHYSSGTLEDKPRILLKASHRSIFPHSHRSDVHTSHPEQSRPTNSPTCPQMDELRTKSKKLPSAKSLEGYLGPFGHLVPRASGLEEAFEAWASDGTLYIYIEL